MATFTFFVDPGHAWLQVTLADIIALGLTAADFSGYSYRHGDTLYLEEDCDATRFLVTYRARNGRMPHLDESYSHRDSPIRALPRLPAAA